MIDLKREYQKRGGLLCRAGFCLVFVVTVVQGSGSSTLQSARDTRGPEVIYGNLNVSK